MVVINRLAGVTRIELVITGSEPIALPLGYTPNIIKVVEWCPGPDLNWYGIAPAGF